jgi:tetratricopeptide (TPR) repeat protein
MENLKFLLTLFVRPGGTMSDVIDRGSWAASALLVLLTAIVFFGTVNTKLHEAYRIPQFEEYYQPNFTDGDPDPGQAEIEYNNANVAYQKAMSARSSVPIAGDRFFKFFSFEPSAFYQPLLSISLFYVPFVILLMSIFGGVGSFGLAIRRDYAALATCTLTAWAAAHIPFAIAGAVLFAQTAAAPEIYLGMWAASSLLFGVFMVFALRTVFGANYGTAVLVVCVGWLAFSLGMYGSRFGSPWLLSPFILFYAFMYFGGSVGGEVRGFGNAFRQKQNFKRFLHNATVNPRDADAHLQLALIYLKRRQESKALEHLNTAVAIDPEEIDANFELGKIKREAGELQEALNHFSIVVGQDDKYCLSEIWREIGKTYLDAGMFAEAADALEKYVDRRPVDPEGLYYFGKVLKERGETERAAAIVRCDIDRFDGLFEHRRRPFRLAPFLQHFPKII